VCLGVHGGRRRARFTRFGEARGMRRLLVAARSCRSLGAGGSGCRQPVRRERRTAVETKLATSRLPLAILNRGAIPARDLVAHLNVLDLTGHTYVDPEDWSSIRTRYLAPIRPVAPRRDVARERRQRPARSGSTSAVLPRSGAPVPPTTARRSGCESRPQVTEHRRDPALALGSRASSACSPWESASRRASNSYWLQGRFGTFDPWRTRSSHVAARS